MIKSRIKYIFLKNFKKYFHKEKTQNFLKENQHKKQIFYSSYYNNMMFINFNCNNNILTLFNVNTLLIVNTSFTNQFLFHL